MHASYSACPPKKTHCGDAAICHRQLVGDVRIQLKRINFVNGKVGRGEKYRKWTSALRQRRRHISSRAELIKKISFEDHILCLMLAYNNIFMIPRASAFWGQGAYDGWKINLIYSSHLCDIKMHLPRVTRKKAYRETEAEREATRMHYEMSRSRVPCAIRHHFFQFLSRRTQPPAKRGKRVREPLAKTENSCWKS